MPGYRSDSGGAGSLWETRGQWASKGLSPGPGSSGQTLREARPQGQRLTDQPLALRGPPLPERSDSSRVGEGSSLPRGGRGAPSVCASGDASLGAPGSQEAEPPRRAAGAQPRTQARTSGGRKEGEPTGGRGHASAHHRRTPSAERAGKCAGTAEGTARSGWGRGAGAVAGLTLLTTFCTRPVRMP